MLTVLIGLTSALVYGAADFLGGTASRRISPVRVTAVAALAGLAVMLLAVATVPAFSGYWSGDVIVLGALSGVTGAVAIGLLYACLAIGPMSILSPLTAVVSAVVPLSIGLFAGERLQTIGYVALGLALVAVVLVGFVPEEGAVRPSLRGLLMAIGSGVSIGVFLVIIDQTPDDSGLVPLVVNRAVTAAIMFSAVGLLALLALLTISRRRAAPSTVAEPVEAPAEAPAHTWLPGLRLAIACGIVDAVANAGLLLGVRIGELSIMAVLTALYPAGTIILAAVVLKERIAPVQIAGLVLAVAAGAMLALA
ncbi:drug/metabolite transporter (DMT)-like permease [Conyzicola nivalis]|uniref:Drug/metabolite transporter (DMT)-like permease n=1 Tax=Conyzicola nivalis TaxID=1477021 RepID=A0ABV2QSB5_9MICO